MTVQSRCISAKKVSGFPIPCNTLFSGVAYQRHYPGSDWKHNVPGILEENQITMVGRYGRGRFQGIAEAMKEGIQMGALLKHCDTQFPARESDPVDNIEVSDKLNEILRTAEMNRGK